LLDNASKHTPRDTPIELSARRVGNAVVLEVADRGPGLPAGAEHLVFERFFQASQTRRGVGLGLAVCRGISVAHGGTIEAVRREGGGTVFRVRLPDGAALPRLDRPPMLQEVTA
jgi:two-component system sensor histidine kinase KdpD